MSLIWRLLINAAALWAATRLVTGISFVGEWWQLFFVALLFGIVNISMGRIEMLTMPKRRATKNSCHHSPTNEMPVTSRVAAQSAAALMRRRQISDIESILGDLRTQQGSGAPA